MLRTSFAATQMGGLLAGLVLGVAASPAAALQIYVNQDAQYRYVNATLATNVGAVPANWFAGGFNDSSWFTGTAPFSSSATSGTFGADLSNVNDPFAPGTAPAIPSSFTQWDVGRDPYLRTYFDLPAPTALTVWIAVDNGIGADANGNPLPSGTAAGMYLNGVQTTASVNAEGQAFRWESVFDIPASYTLAGQNVFALQLEDHGGSTAFTMVVTADDAAPHDTFSTNPPPGVPSVPEPGTVTLLAAALLGLVADRARRGLRRGGAVVSRATAAPVRISAPA